MQLSLLLKNNAPQWFELLLPQGEELLESIQHPLEDELLSHTVFPPKSLIFRALELTPPQSVKAVIIGQDPYHGDGQAHGLAFSVNPGVKFPPSLRNIFKELQSDLGHDIPFSGDLSPWAQQGVLLLNTHLTVRRSEAGSHAYLGWESFTDLVIQRLSNTHQKLVFILWGRHARDKATFIDASRHLILESAHPSPLSAHNGFWDTKPFSKTNDYLKENEKAPIDWKLDYMGLHEQ
jgi:uracil-DNA glycosylase